jgi:hypothetical protein
MKGAGVKPEEAWAKKLFETVTHRTLTEWDIPPRQGAVDFRCTDIPALSLEVKRLTAQGFHDRLAELERVPDFTPSSKLSCHWGFAIEVPTLGQAAPRFKLAGLPEKMEPVLLECEARGIRNTRSASIEFDLRTGYPCGPVFELRKLVGSAIGIATPSTPNLPAGIRFHGAWGHACADDPDRLAVVAEDFLAGASKEATNLRDKLAASDDDERHAFLVLTGAVGQGWLLDDWGTERLPSRPINLPACIERVWITRGGPTVWCCDRSAWSAARIDAGERGAA